MTSYRTIAIGEDVADAVTVGIERNREGAVVASVWWPAHGDIDADEASYQQVEEALAAAEAARALHGFSQVVVMLQSDDLWQPRWGEIDRSAALSDEESFELARATEAMRDA
ncbi:hypothetical protein DMC47_26915 [Nostoc sp. 3335mG]|nr:hypothetical protein DMC47_26915 [Nostoc sp. 3335mG]